MCDIFSVYFVDLCFLHTKKNPCFDNHIWFKHIGTHVYSYNIQKKYNSVVLQTHGLVIPLTCIESHPAKVRKKGIIGNSYWIPFTYLEVCNANQILKNIWNVELNSVYKPLKWKGYNELLWMKNVAQITVCPRLEKHILLFLCYTLLRAMTF